MIQMLTQKRLKNQASTKTRRPYPAGYEK